MDIDKLMKNINKRFKTSKTDGNAMLLSNMAAIPYWIPTGSSLLDAAINKGIPGGKIIEISGVSATGKSALAYTILGNAQRMGGIGILLDTECSVDASFTEKMGVDDKALILSTPNTVEEIFNTTKTLCDGIIEEMGDERNGAPIVVVADSCTSATLEERAKEMGEEPKMGHNAKLQRRGLRNLMPYLQANNITFIGVNHVTAKIGVTYGAKTEVTGGSGWRYYPHIRIKLGNLVLMKGKSSGSIDGVHVMCDIVKNRCGPPHRKVPMIINFNTGFDDIGALLEYGSENGLFGVKQGWLEYEGQTYRKSKLNEYLAEHVDKWYDVADKCKQMLQTSKQAIEIPLEP